MAVTKGHGNAHWNREETILALELYHQLKGDLLKKDSRVAELAKYLKALPYHQTVEQNETFRNVDGVYFKLQNIRNVLTGQGLSNVSRMDKLVAESLGHDPVETSRLSAIIRQNVEMVTGDDFELHEEFEEDFYEGKTAYVRHRKIERDPKLRKTLLKRRSPSNLVCDVCSFSRSSLPVTVQESFFEVHHIVPLSQLSASKPTLISDVALLCACCHRGIHKLMSLEKGLISLEEARSKLVGNIKVK